MEADAERRERAHDLIRAGRLLYGRGWVPATSGNFSARLSDGRIVITVSGRHKGELSEHDIMTVDPEGRPVGGSGRAGQRPSAETRLHTALYRRYRDVGAVLHPHSMNATLISRRAGSEVRLSGYELLKAFHGVTTHETTVVVPVFPNDQDIARLSARVEEYLDRHDAPVGYLIAGHGLYVWGADVSEALRHAEALDFLLECEMRMQGMMTP